MIYDIVSEKKKLDSYMLYFVYYIGYSRPIPDKRKGLTRIVKVSYIIVEEWAQFRRVMSEEELKDV